jgi:hypothetical protein
MRTRTGRLAPCCYEDCPSAKGHCGHELPTQLFDRLWTVISVASEGCQSRRNNGQASRCLR